MHFPGTERMGKDFQKPHGGLTLAEWQVPIQPLCNFLFLTGQGRENETKGPQVKIRTARDHSPITDKVKTDSTWGKLIYC